MTQLELDKANVDFLMRENIRLKKANRGLLLVCKKLYARLKEVIHGPEN